MKKTYDIAWEAKVQRSVGIEAENEEEAYNKWVNGEYGKTDVDDEDVLDDYVEIDGVLYYNSRFEKVKFGNKI